MFRFIEAKKAKHSIQTMAGCWRSAARGLCLAEPRAVPACAGRRAAAGADPADP